MYIHIYIYVYNRHTHTLHATTNNPSWKAATPHTGNTVSAPLSSLRVLSRTFLSFLQPPCFPPKALQFYAMFFRPQNYWWETEKPRLHKHMVFSRKAQLLLLKLSQKFEVHTIQVLATPYIHARPEPPAPLYFFFSCPSTPPQLWLSQECPLFSLLSASCSILTLR